MLEISLQPYRLTIREQIGLSHEMQVVEVPAPDSSFRNFCLWDEATGLRYPAQVSRRNPDRAYLLLSLDPGQVLSLTPQPASGSEIESPVSVAESGDAWIVQNGKFELELSRGLERVEKKGRAAGPIRRVRENKGPWRGRTFFDTAGSPVRERAEWLEQGPLRSVYHYQIEFSDDASYDLELTVDAGLDFARLHETFQGAASDQIVWDFSGEDLPVRLSLLDSTAGYEQKWLHYHFNQRQARLWCWTQFSQLHDLSDGFAMHFADSEDVIGIVALDGGKWKGNALNHFEPWTRRWQASDPTTRRLPGEVKADSFPGTDSIPARGHSINEPHFTLEGWLRRGHRRMALVLSSGVKIAAKARHDEKDDSDVLSHFEKVPRRELYRRLQGRLRKIHIQHGMFPLQDQLGLSFAWPLEHSFTADGAFQTRDHQLAWEIGRIHRDPPEENDPDAIRLIDDFLTARIYGFWEGSGAAYTNCVISRRVGPDMLHFEKLAREGKLGAEQINRWRAWFSFLAHLNFSDNFYPGPASMESMGEINSIEPTMAGMANQNFYTDVIALFGYAAQVFSGHPSATLWREKSAINWRRQLACHMYPVSGVWEESHTYYQHVLDTMLPLSLRKKADGTSEEFADPALQKLAQAAIQQLTPRDAAHSGARHLVTFGDHAAELTKYRHIYREYARAIAPHAPVLAGHLAWIYHEMLGGVIPEVRLAVPALETGYQEGLGYFFRGKDNKGEESLLALRSGMAWAHHHNDDGSIQFYARGHALIIDSASSQPQERGDRKYAATGHSRSTVDGIEPLNHLWRFNRGWILESNAGPNLAYAVAGTPTFTTLPKNCPATSLLRPLWELRAVVQLGPAAYLIADLLDASRKHTVRFHVAQQEVLRNQNRAAASFGSDCWLEIVPLFEVDPPALLLDRPHNPEKIRQESTASVEYGGVRGPWSLFVIVARSSTDQLEVSREAAASRIIANGKSTSIQTHADAHLTVTQPGEPGDIHLNPHALLDQLRAGSRI